MFLKRLPLVMCKSVFFFFKHQTCLPQSACHCVNEHLNLMGAQEAACCFSDSLRQRRGVSLSEGSDVKFF